MTNVVSHRPLLGGCAALLASVCLTSLAVAAPHSGSASHSSASHSFSRDTTTKSSVATSHGLKTVSTTVDATETVTRTVTGVAAGTVSGTLTRDVTGTYTKTIVSPHGRTRVVTGTFDTTGTGDFSRSKGVTTRSMDLVGRRNATFTVDSAAGTLLSSGTVLRNANTSNMQTFRTLADHDVRERFSRSVAVRYTVTPNGGTATTGSTNRAASGTYMRFPETLGGGQSGYRYTGSIQASVSKTRNGSPTASYTFGRSLNGSYISTPNANGGFTTTNASEGQATRLLPDGKTVVRTSSSLQRSIYTPIASPAA